MSGKVIELAQHRTEPGVLWWTGTARCTRCGHEHVAVVSAPAWAAGPGTLECSGCGVVAALLVADVEAACPT